MNQSKKTIKGQRAKKEPRRPINPKIWIAIIAALFILLFAGLIIDAFNKQEIMTVDDEKLYKDDLLYYFYNIELNYDYYTQMFGPSYLDMIYDESTGIRVRDVAKQEIIDGALFNEIIYREAKAKGYSLDEDDYELIESDVDNLMDNIITEAEKKKNNFTRESLTEVLSRTGLVFKYKESVTESFDIDDEAIKAEFDPEEYRQYDIEYFYISTQTPDGEGGYDSISDAEKEEAKEKFILLTADAEDTEDWSTLLPEDETDVGYFSSSFLAKDTYFEEDFKDMMMSMDNGEISSLYDASDGYYLIRMVDNNSTQRYDQEVESAITAKEEELFYDHYLLDVLPNHTFEMNNDYLLSLKVGQLTLDR